MTQALPAAKDAPLIFVGGQLARRYRHAVRRLDDRVAGQIRRHHPRHHHPGSGAGPRSAPATQVEYSRDGKL